MRSTVSWASLIICGFSGGYGHIGNGYGHCRPGGVFVTHRLNSIQHLGSSGCAVNIDDFLKDLLILLLCYEEIDLEL